MQRSILAVAVSTAIGVTLTACAIPTEITSVSSGTVLRNVTVVDTRTGALTPRMAILIDKGQIRQVLPDTAVRVSGNAQVVDAAGKYVVPGYLDMHTHSVPPAVVQKAPHWPLLLANGVTGIRDMAGAPPLIAAAQQFNSARANGTLDAPEVLQIPGPPVVGARTAEEGVAAVRATKAMGGSFVKVVGASPAALTAIVAEARAQGLGVAGHLSPGMGAVDAATIGWTAMEHLGGGWSIALDCADDQAAIRADLLAGKGARMPSPFPPTYAISPFIHGAADAPYVQRSLDTYNSATCNTVMKTVVQKGTWQVPTMIRLRTMTNSDSTEFRNDPNLKYVDPTMRALWNKLSKDFENLQPASAAATFRSSYASFERTLVQLRQNGGAKTMLIGSDVGGIWVIPGFSLHQEFREFAKAGFTPLEILQATTLNGARFLGRENTMGTVEAHKNADLVLLDANPLADVGNLSKIAGVVNAGKYFSKSTLDAMLTRVATAHAGASVREFSTVVDASHKH
ncbi:MAG: amidohydrolase family protein [Gammaproteobacteria bacterium]|nr:amidohydrolase family protein [Gammaproteobacteria bacterium]